MKSSLAVVSSIALAAALSAGAAQARDADVHWSVTIGSPGYSQPYPRPAPVMVDRPIRYQTPTRWDRDGDGIPNRYDRLYNPAWDRDGDGIPNRYDRRHGVDGRPWGDHDRDSVPNRWDRHDHDPWRR